MGSAAARERRNPTAPRTGGASALADADWEEVRARLVAFARRRVDNADDAEDVVHDVLVRALRGAGSLTESGKLDAWLYRITRNVLADRARARNRRPVDAAADEAIEVDRLAAPDEAPDDAEETRAEIARCIEPLVAALPDTYRGAVRLAELEGWKQAEIAERLELSLSGAKSRVQRGRHLLRERLLDCCRVERDLRGSVIDWSRRDDGCGGGCDGC